jgi:hypothetical protein
LAGKPVQITTEQLTGFSFDTNVIYDAGTSTYLAAYGSRFSNSNPNGESMQWWQSNHPELFANTLESAPMYADESAHDFHLRPSSPAIDAGTFLTRTTDAGTGDVLQVEDAGYFYDGFQIAGEQGDTIQLEGDSAVAVVTKVDYATNTLTLDRSLSWAANQGVALRYNGSAPDIGAYETGGGKAPPSPPVLSAP